VPAKQRNRYEGRRGQVAGLLLLLVRAVLLWIVVPVTLIAWLLMWPYLRARRVGAGQLLGWADLNLVATIEHTILRPLQPSPYPWIPLRALPTVAHRIGTADAA
jgi:hypothetical protein